MAHLLAGVVGIILIGLFGRVILQVALKALFFFSVIYMFVWLFLADHNHRIPSVSTPEHPCWSERYHRGQRFFTDKDGTYPSPICND